MTRRAHQGSPEWHEERRTGYGASDAPILIEGDEERWRLLHAVKLGLVPDAEGTETMELGKRLEDAIAQVASERLGEPLVRVNQIVRHREHRFVFASLDRRRKRGNRRPLEVKKWAYKGEDWGPEGSDEVPDKIRWQLQQQAAVTNADAIDVAVLFAGQKIEMFTVGRDETEIEEIIQLEAAAWAYVERGEMPPWPGPAARRPTLRADEIPADESLTALVDDYLQIKADLKAVEKQEAEAKERLRQSLADVGGARGVLPSGLPFTVTHRPSKDATPVPWKELAAGYRRRLLELGVPEAELAFAETALTTVKPGPRPIRVTVKENTRHAA